jgi:hypothetical protein
MTASLTPALALAYLQQLSVDVRAAVVLDAAGQPLAGEAGLAAAARELLTSTEVCRRMEGGTLLVARTADGGGIAVLAGAFCLLPVLEQDLATAAEGLANTRSEPLE